MTADFKTQEVTGSAYNFSDSNDQAFLGALGFTGDVEFGGNSLIPDSLWGTLEGDLAADGTTYDTVIILDRAEFKGGSGLDLPDAVSGVATGDLLDINNPLDGFLLDGDFIAEKP